MTVPVTPMDATLQQRATPQNAVVNSVLGLAALSLVFSIAAVLFALKCHLLGPLWGSLFGPAGFAVGVLVAIIVGVCGNHMPDNWAGLAERIRWLQWLRRPLQLLALMLAITAVAGSVVSPWANRPGVASDRGPGEWLPILAERQRYELNSHGHWTEVSRLQYVLAGVGFAAAWHGFIGFGLTAELYFLLFSFAGFRRQHASLTPAPGALILPAGPDNRLSASQGNTIRRHVDERGIKLSWDVPPLPVLLRLGIVAIAVGWLGGWSATWAEMLGVLRSGGAGSPVLYSFSFAAVSLGGPLGVLIIVAALLPARRECVWLGSDSLRYSPGSAPDYFESQFHWGSGKKDTAPHPSVAGLSLQKRSLRLRRDEVQPLVLEWVAGRQRLCLTYQGRKIEIGACLPQPQREWLHAFVEAWRHGESPPSF